jgi:hypothetical protein
MKMENGNRSLVIFLLGTVVGAVATYYVLERLMAEKAEELVQAEIESLREVKAERHGSPEVIKVRSQDVHEKVVSKLGYKPKLENLHPVDSDEDEDEEDEEMDPIAKQIKEHGVSEPYVISLEQFSEERDYYDKITIYYYNEDDTLADDNEEVIVDVIKHIGTDALTCFGDESDDEDIVYIRNEHLTTDYEVIRYHKSYQKTVLGITSFDEHKAVRSRDRNED